MKLSIRMILSPEGFRELKGPKRPTQITLLALLTSILNLENVLPFYKGSSYIEFPN